jgi:RNA polymerase sigma factor (sigma-70 family)
MATTSLDPVLRHIRQLAEAGPSLTDGALLERYVVRRDEAAFEALVRRHGPMVLGVGRRLLHDRDAAEDMFQATFLVLARHARRLDQRGSLGGWLYTVAYRLALKAKADMRRHRRHDAAAPRVPATDPLAELSARELCGLLDEELQRLPEKYRLPLLLCCVEGKTRDEAARQLGWTPDQVKAGLERGRARLKQRLARRGVALSAVLVAATVSQGAPVSAALLKATVRLASSPASGAVTALANAVGRTGLMPRVQVVALVLLTAGLGGIGLAISGQAEEPLLQATDTKDKEPGAKNQESKTDAHGDPLPPGAITRLGTVRMRHGYMTYDAVFSPDSKLIASGGAGRGVCLWDATTGKEVRHFLPKWSEHAYSVAFSPDGTLLAGGAGGVLYLWDLTTGAEKLRIENKQGRLHVAFSPDGKLLASGSNDLVQLWDTTTGQELAKLSGHENGIPAVAFAPNGKYLATASSDKTIRVWDVASRAERHRFAGSGEYFIKVAISPDSKLLAARGADEKVHLWDPITGKEVRGLEDERGWGRCLAFSPDGSLLATCSADGVVRLWDPATGKMLRKWQGQAHFVNSLAFSRDGKRLVTTGVWQSGPRVWDVATGKELLAFPGHAEPVDQVLFTPDGKTLISNGRFEAILRWDLATGQASQPFTPATGEIVQVVLAHDGKTLATLGRDSGVLRLWDVALGKEVRQLGKIAKPIGNLLPPSLVFSPDGRMVAAISEQKNVFIWEVATNKEPRRFSSGSPLNSLAFSADGKRLAAGRGGPDSGVVIWDIERAFAVWLKKTGSMNGELTLAVSPDGKRIATSAWSGGVHVWDIPTSKKLYTLTDTEHGAYELAFSPDGRFLVSTGIENHPGVTVWEMATGQQVRQFTGHVTGACSVAFSPDGRRVASGGADSVIYLWDMTGHAQPLDRKETELDQRWRDLASSEAPCAVQAVWDLALSPRQAVPFLQKKLKRPEPIAEERLKKLISDLDSDQFDTRSAASKELGRIGEQAETALRQALANDPSPELRKRLEQLLTKLEPAKSPERLRELRAVQALEYTATPDARQLLERLAANPGGTWLTREAKAALQRMQSPTR